MFPLHALFSNCNLLSELLAGRGVGSPPQQTLPKVYILERITRRPPDRECPGKSCTVATSTDKEHLARPALITTRPCALVREPPPRWR